VKIEIQSQGSSDSISPKPTAEATPIHNGFVVEKSGARLVFLRIPRFPPVGVILPTVPQYMFIFQWHYPYYLSNCHDG